MLSTGGLKCWGSNAGSRLGDGTVSNQPMPVDVLGLTSGVSGVSAGPSHTCVVTSAGAVKCWGTDSFGELGNDADLIGSPSPVTVYGAASGFKSVSAGDAFTCAVTTAGGLKCWGRADMGKLGNGMDAGCPAYSVGCSRAYGRRCSSLNRNVARLRHNSLERLQVLGACWFRPARKFDGKR